MLENNIGFISLDASTNFDKTKAIVVITQQDEDDIEDYGFNK